MYLRMPPSWLRVWTFFLDFYLFIFRERGMEGKKRRETLMCGCLWHTPYWGPDLQIQACPLSRNLNGSPLVCRLAFTLLSHTSQEVRGFLTV